MVNLRNYSLGASYCRKTFLKGGVSIFVCRKLKYNTISLDEFNIDKDIEACAILLDSTSDKLCILNIYRSPSGNFTNFLRLLDLILQKLCKSKYKIIICGDVNVNYLLNDNRRIQLDAVLHSYNLMGIVNFPTRFGVNSQLAIDNVFIDTSKIGEYELCPFINGLSDHDAQYLTLKNGEMKVKECHTYFKRKINKYTIADFQTNSSRETWEQVLDGTDVNEIFNSFLNIFLRIYNSSFPLNQVKNNLNQNAWITPGIMTSCKYKRELYKVLHSNNNATLVSYYKSYCKILSMVIKKAKIKQHDTLIMNSHNKVKTTWDIINKESGRKEKINEPLTLKSGDKKITDQQTIAKTLNEYFVAIAESINRRNIHNSISNDNSNMDSHTYFMEQAFNKPYPNMEGNCTTAKEIERIIQSLKTKTSYGYDEISTQILKISCPFISSPINHICNKMLFWGDFPNRLKYAIIKPLHKNDDRCEVSNYRPISLLTSFSKIFETVMQKRILKHLTKYNILSTEQYGFRVGLRTDNATYKLTTEILNAMNNKLQIGGIFCDLEKAFDCVNHDILLSKLKFYGINDKYFQLFQSYLNNRYCRTALYNNSDNRNIVSNWATVRHGVPQGSILGPLLFLLYK